MPFFERLVDAFYTGVASDDVLLPLYPEAPDLRGARHRLTLFLAQYWGGPTTYNDERGHPRLRMRHMPFTVGPLQRDHWLRAHGRCRRRMRSDGGDRRAIDGLLHAGGRADAQRHRPADLVAGSAPR